MNVTFVDSEVKTGQEKEKCTVMKKPKNFPACMSHADL